MTEFLDACYSAIRKQGKAIPETLASVDVEETNIINNGKRIVLVGCGDSYAVAEYGKWAFLKVGLNAISLSPTEMSHITLGKRSVVIGVTASGRSLATIAALDRAKSKGATTVVLTDDPEGKAVESADRVWITHSGVNSYNISPSAPTTTAMVYMLKVAGGLANAADEQLHHDVMRLETLGKKLVDWADRKGSAILEMIDVGRSLYLISEGPNYVAAMIGHMKFNEYSLMKSILGRREEVQHHYALSINDNDRAVLVSNNPVTSDDMSYMNVLTKTLKMQAYHLYADDELELFTSLAQTIPNAIALQMAAYHTVLRFDSSKKQWKQPHADAFKIY
jgi:glucosamine 6-phosphate synthetase-like amidotransferase/phosphosugar isomerase protein